MSWDYDDDEPSTSSKKKESSNNNQEGEGEYDEEYDDYEEEGGTEEKVDDDGGGGGEEPSLDFENDNGFQEEKKNKKNKKKSKFSKFTGAFKNKVDETKLNSLANTLKTIGTEIVTTGEGTSGGDIAVMSVAQLRAEVVSLRKENADLIDELERDLNDSDFEDNDDDENNSTTTPSRWKRITRYWRKIRSINKKDVFIPNNLNPTKPEHRTWRWYHIMFLFISMVIDVPTYMVGSSLVGLGLPWWGLFIIIVTGNILITIPMIIVADPGMKYGIPFPVLIRSTFGVHGAKLAALFRAAFASGWFGIQCWIGGYSLYSILVALDPHFADNGINPDLGSYLGFWIFDGVRLLPLVFFLTFWAINMAVVFKGLHFMRSLEIISALYLVIVCTCLVIWAIVVIKGDIPQALDFLQNDLLDNGASDHQLNRVWAVWMALNAVIGSWADVTVNATDYSRFSPKRYHYILGTVLGFPATAVIITIIGAFVTSCAYLKFGQVLWNPVTLVSQFTPLFAILGLASFAIAALSTNISANTVSPSNDFSNLNSRRISVKRGGIITGVLGIICMPWKLIMNQDTFLQVWLLSCGCVIGSLTGVVVFDYLVIKKRNLDIKSLYEMNNKSEYWFKVGWNWRSWVSLLVALMVLLPGALGRMGLWNPERNGFSQFVDRVYLGGWILGILLGSGIYALIVLIEKLFNNTRTRKRVEMIGNYQPNHNNHHNHNNEGSNKDFADLDL